MMRRTGLILAWSFLMLFSTSLSTPTSASRALPEQIASAVFNTTYARTPVPDVYVNQAYPTTNDGAETGTTSRAMTAATSKVFLPFITNAPVPIVSKPAPTTAPPATGNVRVLCDGKVYDGYTSRPFQLESTTDKDPNILKIIRNCVFRNSKEAAIVIRDAKNVLIEGNIFENIRTHIAGDGVHAINVACESGCAIDNITIRNNSFKYIGADGVQLGQNTRNIRHVYIQNNEFVGRDDVGENAVDVKGVEGPIYITGNKVHGFRPCESPKTKVPGTQDCSGSPGEGIVIHDGGAGLTPAYNVTVENNDIYDNTLGLSITSGTRNIVARGNRIHNNIKIGTVVSGVYSVSVTGNTLSYNPTHINVSNTPLSGGSCNISGNTFIGGGTAMNGGCK